jgi:dienelactone hydrolase
VATPNKDQVDAVNQSQVTADILLTNLADLQFTKAFASQMDNVDADRVCVMGWAWGAMPALALSFTDPNISGMVSLDGGQRFQGQRQVVQSLGFFQAAKLTTPTIHFETTNIPAPQAVDYTFHDDVKYADAHHYKLHDAWWFSMSSYFNIVHGKGVNDATRFYYETIDRNHDFVMERTRSFLDLYVAGDASARSEVMSDAPDGIRAENRRTEGITPPPTEAHFTRLFNSDAEAAVALWNRVKERDPNYVIAQAATLNALGYALIGQGDTESALLALKLQAETYYWMAMG